MTTSTDIIGREPSTFKLIFTLAFAGLLSGLSIVTVYEWTLPIIEANNAKFLKAAVLDVVPNAVSMRKLILREQKLHIAADDDKSAGIYAACDKHGKLVGYAISHEGPGFQDTIVLIYGFDPISKSVVGMKVLESRETPGLGDKIYKDEDWVRQNFRTLQIAPQINVIKPKPGQKKAPNEVDAITGATISAVAVANIINQANKRWLPFLLPQDQLPPALTNVCQKTTQKPAKPLERISP
jgi:electron transport complex protein RnfG